MRLLADVNVLQLADLAVLSSYCRTWAESTKLTQALVAIGTTRKNRDRKQARLPPKLRAVEGVGERVWIRPASRTRIHPVAQSEAKSW